MNEIVAKVTTLISVMFWVLIPPYVAVYLSGCAIAMDWNWWANAEVELRFMVALLSPIAVFVWFGIIRITAEVWKEDE